MGDRGNVRLFYSRHEDTPIYLYTHWLGSALPQVVARALDSDQCRNRWTDEAYCARIIFCHLVGVMEDSKEPSTPTYGGEGGNPFSSGFYGETGFGISLDEQDNENPYVDVDLGLQTVSIGSLAMSYEDFIASIKGRELLGWDR